MLRDFFLGIVKIHILHQASRRAVYGQGLMGELNRLGHPISPGTLYPILHALEAEKLLRSHKETVSGKMRRYYRITTKGRKALQTAREQAAELVRDTII